MSASIPPINGLNAPTAAYGTPGSGVQPDTRSLQRFLDEASAGTQLKFRVDSDAGRVVVQVLDLQSGEVLRQIPREEALQLARNSLQQRETATEASSRGGTSVRA